MDHPIAKAIRLTEGRKPDRMCDNPDEHGCGRPKACPLGCGYPADSFACKVRHLAINTGDAKAANDR